MSLTISAIPQNLIDIMWPMTLPHIKKVVDKAPDEVCLDVLKQALKDGHEWMVTISDGEEIVAVNILKVSVFDTGYRTLYIPIVGGERMEEWLEDFLKLAHQAARDLNCVELRGIACRPGWIRKLKDYDWYRVHEIIGCKVEPLNKERED